MHYLILLNISLALVLTTSLQMSTIGATTAVQHAGNKNTDVSNDVGTNTISMNTVSDSIAKVKSKSHLIVLSHGLMGFPKDLTTLSEFLKTNNCSVLVSKSNEFTKSLRGIEVLAESLVEEIIDFIQIHNSQYQQSNSSSTSTSSSNTNDNKIELISFVGNSLGGMIARYALKLLLKNSLFTSMNVSFYKFMTIATPHLGVYHYNAIDSYDIRFPGISILKKTVKYFTNSRSIKDLMPEDETSLLYQMAIDEEYLSPLRQFKERRLYANLKRDLVVPLGTAAFLPKAQVQLLRQKYHSKSGFVYYINTSMNTAGSSCSASASEVSPSLLLSDDTSSAKLTKQSNDICTTLPSTSSSSIIATASPTHVTDKDKEIHASLPLTTSLSSDAIANEKYLIEMIASLDSLGWQKYIVNFPSMIPLAHNKLCALKRSPTWLYEDLLGFNKGVFVMEHAAKWLVS